MPVFKVETAGKKILTIEAGSPQEAYDKADEWQRSQPVDGQPLGDESAAAGRAVIDGIPIAGPYLTAGLDRAIAGARSIGLGGEKAKSYDEELKHVQEWGQKTADNSPKSTVFGNVLGGVTAGVAAAPLVGALAPASRAGQIGLGVIGNGAVSGIDAGIRAPEGQKFQAGGLGTAVGAVGGAVAPLLGTLARKAVDGVYNVGARAGVLRGSGVTPAGARTITRTFGPDADTAVRAAGPNGMIADAGPATSGTLDALIQRGGPAANDAIRAIDDRAAQSGAALNRTLDKTLGAPEGVHTAETNIRTSTKAARSAAYDGPGGAYDQPIDYSHPQAYELEDLLQRVPGRIIQKANGMMQLGGHRSRQIMADIADDGTVTFKTMPDVRQIDYITRALRQEASAGEGAGVHGGQTDLGGLMQSLARDIRGKTRALVPEYGKALDTAADPASRRQALLFGSEMLRPSVARDVVADTVHGMSKAEIAAAKQGVRSQVDEVLANVKRTLLDPNTDAREASAALKMFSGRAARDKLSHILSPQELDSLMGQLDEAGRSLNLRAATATNSKTAARLGVTEALDQQSAPGVVSNLMQGKLPSAFASGMQLATGTTPADLLALKDELAGQITKALTEKRGNDALRLMAQLRQAEAMMQRGNANAKMIGRGVSGGVVGGSAVLPGSVLERDRASRR
jgi:hypothetical protein